MTQRYASEPVKQALTERYGAKFPGLTLYHSPDLEIVGPSVMA